MRFFIKNESTSESLFISAMARSNTPKSIWDTSEEDEPEKFRTVLRPGEEERFKFPDNWIVGLEKL